MLYCSGPSGFDPVQPEATGLTMSDNQDVSMDAFSDLLNEQLESYRKGFDPGQKVSGIVVETVSLRQACVPPLTRLG